MFSIIATLKVTRQTGVIYVLKIVKENYEKVRKQKGGPPKLKLVDGHSPDIMTRCPEKAYKTWHALALHNKKTFSLSGTPGNQRPFYVLHDSASHSTEECFTVITLRKKGLDIQPTKHKGSGYNKPSGYAMRPVHYRPG